MATGRLVVDKAVSELKNGERLVGPPKTAAGKRGERASACASGDHRTPRALPGGIWA